MAGSGEGKMWTVESQQQQQVLSGHAWHIMELRLNSALQPCTQARPLLL